MVAKGLGECYKEYSLACASRRFDVATPLAATEEFGGIIDDTLLVAIEDIAFLAVGDIALEIAKVPFTR
ncbi:hypothetical protein D9M68_765740 [compost metagenome]